VAAPDIAVDGSNVHITWGERGDLIDGTHPTIYTIRSTNGGKTWRRVRPLTNNPINEFSPQVTVMGIGENAVVVVVFRRYGTNKVVMCRRSIDNGRTWLPVQRVRGYTAENAAGLAVYGADGIVYVVWPDDRRTPGAQEVFLRKSLDAGATWLPVQRLTRTDPRSITPDVSGTGTEVFVTWMEIGSTYEVYSRKSTDASATWGTVRRVSTVPHESMWPEISASDGRAHIVWMDEEPGNTDIYYRHRN
jgi:hypothetical protein